MKPDRRHVRISAFGLAIGLMVGLVAALSAQSGPRPPVALPADWRWEQTRLPQALVVNGLWSKGFRVDEALDIIGFRRQADYKGLPKDSVIVLVNVSAVAMPPGAMEAIREFVSRGGGLVVLGGLSAYDNGAYKGTLLETLLPVGIQDSYIGHFATAEKGAPLARADGADWPATVDFKAGPMAYYFHTLTPTNGARVQVAVGARPALVSGTFGQGRVVACALTVNGDPPPGVLPFWAWNDWPALLGQAIAWAAGARPVGTAKAGITEKGDDLKPLTQDELRSAELETEAVSKDFVQRAVAHPDERAAKVLIDLAAPEKDEAKCDLAAVLPALLPYAKPEWGPQLKTAADDWNPNLETRKAALILLGASRASLGYDPLVKALKDKKTEGAALDGLGRLGRDTAIPLIRRRLEEILKPARLPAGPDRWSPAEFAAAAGPAAHATVALYRLGDPEAVSNLFAFAGNLNLYRRILWNSTKRWPRDPAGQKILEGLREQAGQFQKAWEYLAGNVGPIPDSQADAFVRYARTVSDPVLVNLAADAMEKSIGRAPKADWASLSEARSGIVAKMGTLLIESGKP